MLHTCVRKFDVMGIVEIFLGTKHPLGLLVSLSLFSFFCYHCPAAWLRNCCFMTFIRGLPIRPQLAWAPFSNVCALVPFSFSFYFQFPPGITATQAEETTACFVWFLTDLLLCTNSHEVRVSYNKQVSVALQMIVCAPMRGVNSNNLSQFIFCPHTKTKSQKYS